jgi:transcription elongation factor Elf1
MSRLVFGDLSSIKELQRQQITEWLKKYIDDIMNECSAEHCGICPHCGQEMDCDSDDYDYTIIEYKNDALQVLVACSECDFEFEFTINKLSVAMESDDWEDDKIFIGTGCLDMSIMENPDQLKLEGLNAV